MIEAQQQQPNANSVRLVRPGVAARWLGVSQETIRRWMRKGALPYVEVGPARLKRIREADVAAQLRPRAAGE